MVPSAKKLYDYFDVDENAVIDASIIHDLFGFFNWTPDMKADECNTISMFIGLYKGLYLMDVTWNEIHRCYSSASLELLLTIKYSQLRNKYYNEYMYFKNRGFNIDTYIIDDEDNSDNDDSMIPLIYTTINPPYHLMTHHTDNFPDINNTNIEDAILHKINGYKRQDEMMKRYVDNEKYISVESVKKQLLKQYNRCYVCGDTVILTSWNTNCSYQFTLDRIDNSKPHNKDNCLICCYYCNCREYPTIVLGMNENNGKRFNNKICEHSCHQIKRDNIRKLSDVSPEEKYSLRFYK